MNQVREALNKDNNVERIKNVFGYSIEEINYYIDFAEAFIPMVR
ncbi:Gp55 protein, putative [Enterococcus faecium E4453]|nr:Gp55 protein, putative [Enterococcus faecium E4453]